MEGSNLKYDLELLNVTNALWTLLFSNTWTLDVVFTKTWILLSYQRSSTYTSVENQEQVIIWIKSHLPLVLSKQSGWGVGGNHFWNALPPPSHP